MAIFTDADRLTFVNEGQKVTLVFVGGAGLPCVVTMAAGDCARVEPEYNTGTYAGRSWFVRVSELFPELPAKEKDVIKNRKADRKKG